MDNSGNVVVAGWTNSAGCPTTPDAFDRTLNAFTDAFVTKMNPTGSNLLYSTYLGGLSNEEAFGLAVDASGNMYVTGETTSGNFPTSPTAFDTTYGAAQPGRVRDEASRNPTALRLLQPSYHQHRGSGRV